MKVKIFDLANSQQLVWLVSLSGSLLIMPLFHNQTITGPLVNAIFFIALYFLGLRDVLLLAFLPSLVALSAGTLPTVLAPMVPYIIVSNAILICAFGFLRQKNFWLGVLAASVLKFSFLYASVFYLVSIFSDKKLPQSAATMMSWPQFYSALAGGVIAFIFLKSIKRI